MYDDDERGRNGRVTRVYGYHQVSRKERGIKRGGALAMERAATGASPYTQETNTLNRLRKLNDNAGPRFIRTAVAVGKPLTARLEQATCCYQAMVPFPLIHVSA